MAKIGFEYIVAGKLNEAVSVSAATAKYTESREIGPGATFSGTPTSGDVKDYGDDRTLLTDVSVTGGTLSAELNEPTLGNEAWLLGHTYSETDGMLRNINDIPPYVGVGLVGKSKKDNDTVIYRAKVYLKAQFKEPTDESSTKQESVTFSHTTLEGNLFQLENGDWKQEKDFATLAEAKTYLNGIIGVTEETA